MYLHHPDIENWIRRDRCGEVTLYHQIEEKGSTDEHHIIYTIDPRNGALYYYEGFPWDRAAPEEAHPATYAELAQTDPRYTGMTIQNWEKYLPKKVNSAQDPFPKNRKQRSKTAQDQNDPFHRARSPYEIAGPHRTSLYEQESDRFLFLSDAHLAGELEWGQQEYFAVDTETWQPFYIITQYDGVLVAQTWYHVKEAVKWEEVETYGDPVCKRQLTDRPKGQWKDLVVETKTSADRFRIRWRSRRQHNEDVEIQAKETAFLLIRHHKDPSRAQTEKELPRSMAQDEAAFRDAVRSFGIYKAYIIQRLWAFCSKPSKSKINSDRTRKSDAEGDRTEHYRELFISQFLDQHHYAAVIYEEETNCFYNALFSGRHSKKKGRAISIDVVRKLARRSEDSRADNYVNISEANWQELLRR